MSVKQQEYKSKARIVKKKRQEEEEELSPEELLEQVKQLQKENLELKSELEKVEKKVVVREKAIDKKIPGEKKVDLSGYDNSWTWVNKLLFILKRADKPLQSKEILKLLEQVDKAFKYYDDKQKTLSGYLNKAVKYERIKQYKVRGSGGFFYCLPEWFDGDKLKKEYSIN